MENDSYMKEYTSLNFTDYDLEFGVFLLESSLTIFQELTLSFFEENKKHLDLLVPTLALLQIF